MKKKIKHKGLRYCKRTLVESIYYALCISEKDFYHELKRIGIKRDLFPTFLAENVNASVHIFTHTFRETVAILCVNVNKSKTKHINVIHGLLVHEAVHIYEECNEYLNEKNPGSEYSAYSIQSISQNLFDMYDKLIKNLK